MAKLLDKWLSRLLMALIAMAVGVPLTHATVTVNVKATAPPYVYAWFDHNGTKVEPLGGWPGTVLSAGTNLQNEAVWHVDITNETDDNYRHNVSLIIHNNAGNQTADITSLESGLYEYSYDGFTQYKPLEICVLDNGFWYGKTVMSAPHDTYILDYRENKCFGYLTNQDYAFNKVYAWNSTTGKVYTAGFPGDDLSETVTAPAVNLRAYNTGGYSYESRNYYAFEFALEDANDPGPDRVIFVDSNSAYDNYGSTEYGSRTGDLVFINGAVYKDSRQVWTIRPSRDIDATLIPDDFIRGVITGDIADLDYDYNKCNIDMNSDGKLSNYELLGAWGFKYHVALPSKWDSFESNVDPKNAPVITSLSSLKIFPYLYDIHIEYPLAENAEQEHWKSQFSLRDFGYSEGNLGNVVIPDLPHLGKLTLNNCGITSIDVTGAPNLVSLELTGNRLTSLDVSACPALESLYLSDNQITASALTGLATVQNLNLSRNPITSFAPTLSQLNNLAMDVCQLESLDLSGLPLLGSLSASSNQLTTIDVTHNPMLHEIQLARNKLSSIDLSSQAGILQYYDYGLMVDVSFNNFSTIDLHPVSPCLYRLAVSGNNLGTLDLSYLTFIEELYATSCNLTSVNLPRTNKSNYFVYLNNNNLSNLDVSYVNNLSDLYVGHNPLGTLTLGSQPNMNHLWVDNTNLTSLDVSQCPKLRELNLLHNQLNENSVQWPPAVTYDNGSPAPRRSTLTRLAQQLKERAGERRQAASADGRAKVDRPKREPEPEVNHGLTDLYLADNAFRSLDLEGMPYLEHIFTASNQLAALDMSNQHEFEQDFAQLISMMYGVHPDYDDYISPNLLIMYDLDKATCNGIASHGYTAEQAADIKGVSWISSTDDIIRDVCLHPEIINDLGYGNRREVTSEWAVRNGENVYFIRLDSEAAGSKELLTDNTFLGPDFVTDRADNWNGAEVVNDPDYGHILLLTNAAASGATASGEVTYAYDTQCPDAMTITFGFTWTAPAAPTVEGGASDITLTPGDGTTYNTYREVVITIPTGVTVTVTIDGEPVEVLNNGTDSYIVLPYGNNGGVEGHTVVVTPSEGDPVTATFTFMPNPGKETHWTTVWDEPDLLTDTYSSKPFFFGDLNNMEVRAMSIKPADENTASTTHVATNETAAATANATLTGRYDVTLPYNSTADMYSITKVEGVDHGYHIKSFITGKYLVFNGTPYLQDSDEPAIVYMLSNHEGFYGFLDMYPREDGVDHYDEGDQTIMRAIYYDVDYRKFMAYKEDEAIAREHDGHPTRMVYLFYQTDEKPAAPVFSEPEGAALRYGTRVEITNSATYSDNYLSVYTADVTDPTVLGGAYRFNYKDFIEIEDRHEGYKGNEPYMTGTFPTLEGTLTLRAVNAVGYLYSDETTVHYSCIPQEPYSFEQVTSADQLVAGKRYLVVATSHDKDGDYHNIMGALTRGEDARFNSDEFDIPASGIIDLEPWYYPEPYILGGSAGAWTFKDNTYGKYVGATTYEIPGTGGMTRVVPVLNDNTAAPFSITLNNDNTVVLDFGSAVGQLTLNSKGAFMYGDPDGNDDLLYMRLFVEKPAGMPELSLADGTIYTVYNGSQTNVTITATDGSSAVSYRVNGGETQTASSPATVTLPEMSNYTGVTLEAWSVNNGVESAHATATYTYVTPITEEMAYTRYPNDPNQPYTLLVPGRVVTIGADPSADDNQTNKFFSAVPVGKTHGESDLVNENVIPASRGVSVYQFSGYNLKTINTLPGATFDEFTLEEATGEDAFYLRSRHVNDNNKPLYLQVTYDATAGEGQLSYGTTPQALYFKGNNVNEHLLISNYPLPAQGESDPYSGTRATLTFNVDSQEYSANTGHNISLPCLYVKSPIPGLPTLNPSTTQHINPESGQKTQAMHTGTGGAYVVYLTQEEYDQLVATLMSEGRIDASCYHISASSSEYVNVPTDKSTKYYVASVSEFGIMSDMITVEYLYTDVVVPMPTFDPAPGNYRGDYLDISIVKAEGHENDRVFFTVGKNRMPDDPTSSDREYTGHKFRVNDGIVVVKAVAMDAQGNMSAVNTGYYNLREDQPFDFRRANSLDDLVPGREFIFVYENSDDIHPSYYNGYPEDYNDYGAMLATPNQGQRGRMPSTRFDYETFMMDIVNGNLLIVSKEEGLVDMVNKDVSVFELGKVGDKYTFFDFNNEKFLASPATGNGIALVDDAATDTRAQFAIAIDATTHAADMSADGEIGIAYDLENKKFGFFASDSQKRIALYYRERNHMTLAEFKELDVEGEKDNNGNVTRTVVINEPLTVAYVADAKEPIDGIGAGYLVLTDNSASTDRFVTPADGQKDFLIKGVGSYFPQNTVEQKNYTQKNWLLVELVVGGEPLSERYKVGDVIKANTVSGMAYHSLPMVLAFNSTLQPQVDTEAERQTVVYNTYAPGNFNDENLNLDNKVSTATQYFTMSPKRFEVAHITYAVYKNSPAPGMYSKDGEDAAGSFYVNLDGNIANGRYGTGEGQAFTSTTTTADVFSSADDGKAYEFVGIVFPNDGWDEDGDDGYDDDFEVVYDIDTDNPVLPSHAPRNPFKVRSLAREKSTPANVEPNGTLSVLILDIDATDNEDSSVITGIEDIINGASTTVKAVRYYNAAGMESDKPFEGVNIIVTEMTDGSRIVNKELK